MRIITTCAAFACLSLLSCKAKDPSIDGESDESTRKSIEELSKEFVSEEEKSLFGSALIAIAYGEKGLLAHIDKSEKELAEVWRKNLDGKTLSDVREMMKKIESSTSEKKEEMGDQVKTEKIRLGDSVTIDGVEIVFKKARIAPLPEAKQEGYLRYKLPEGAYLMIQVAITNKSETRIVSIQDPWEHTILRDDFDNAYISKSFSMNDAVSGKIEGRMRPGDAKEGFVFFESPLENASAFIMSGDPGFYKNNGDGTLDDLSDSKFELSFDRNEISE